MREPVPRVTIVPVPFVCRVCRASTSIYCKVEATGLGWTFANDPRVVHTRCSDCGQDRTHVLSDVATDSYGGEHE